MNTSKPEPPKLLDRALWQSVGLFRWNGVVTHSLGDEHAQRILTGEIPLAEAQEAERNARDHAYYLMKGLR